MKNIKGNITQRFKGMTIKSYIKDTRNFFNTNIKKTFVILSLITLLIISIGVPLFVQSIQAVNDNIEKLDGVTFGASYISNIQVIFIVILAGIAPYMYVPVIGSLLGAMTELTTLSYLIVEKGYLEAILICLLPMVLNICIFNMAAALGIYICRIVTLRYRISNMNNMNFVNFKLKLYEATNNDKKKKELEDKKIKKLSALETKNKKLDYFQLINITVILFILQIIASIIETFII